MISLEDIHKNLAMAIMQSGMTQSEIAKKINVKQPTLSQYVSGRTMPALDTFANLCNVLDLDANDILCVKKYWNE